MSLKTLLAGIAAAITHLGQTDGSGRPTLEQDAVADLKKIGEELTAGVENFDAIIEQDVAAALARLGYSKPASAPPATPAPSTPGPLSGSGSQS